jgi:hypothetical protein
MKLLKRDGSKNENDLLKKLKKEFKKEKNDKLFVTFSPNKKINNNNLVPFLIEENVLFNKLNNNDLLFSMRSLNSFRNTNNFLKNSILKEKLKKYEIFNNNYINNNFSSEKIKKIYFSGTLPNLNKNYNQKINIFRENKLSGLYHTIRNEKYKKFKEKMHQKNIWENNNNN